MVSDVVSSNSPPERESSKRLALFVGLVVINFIALSPRCVRGVFPVYRR